jgi:hypothetical protein
VFVLGFKGCEPKGDGRDGEYVIRQEHAHAWVSALVAKAGEPFDPRDPSSRLYHWRSLDPTPGAGGGEGAGKRAWWQQANNWVDSHFQEYVTNYTSEQRQKSLASLVYELRRPEIVAAMGVLAFGLLIARSIRSRRRNRNSIPASAPESSRWFGELLAVLEEHGMIPAPGATPLEFARSASTTLQAIPASRETAGVPLDWAQAYYLDRYAGTPPSEVRLAELEAGLGALRRALRSGFRSDAAK